MEGIALSAQDSTTVEGLVRLLAARYPAFGDIAYRGVHWSGAFQLVIGERHFELAGG